jgi:hypothetical protein
MESLNVEVEEIMTKVESKADSTWSREVSNVESRFIWRAHGTKAAQHIAGVALEMELTCSATEGSVNKEHDSCQTMSVYTGALRKFPKYPWMACNEEDLEDSSFVPELHQMEHTAVRDKCLYMTSPVLASGDTA